MTTTQSQINPLSTITMDELLPTAEAAARAFCRKGDRALTMKQLGSHYTIEDLAMDAVEKVLKASPEYLTKSYVWFATRCVALTLVSRGKLMTLDDLKLPTSDEDGEIMNELQTHMEGEGSYDFVLSLEQLVLDSLTGKELTLYSDLIEDKSYPQIAKEMGVSVRTLERRIHDLKARVNMILELDGALETLISNRLGQ